MRNLIYAAFTLGMAIEVTGCATVPNRIVRDSQTYSAEIYAGLVREREAAAALIVAAEAALEEGDSEACVTYASAALTIEAYAENAAYRALWLAGLPYPDSNGELPSDPSAEQEDPGAPSAARDAGDFCEVTNE